MTALKQPMINIFWKPQGGVAILQKKNKLRPEIFNDKKSL